jgi:hypothetical protein
MAHLIPNRRWYEGRLTAEAYLIEAFGLVVRLRLGATSP